ncbi:MAG: ATP-binding protein [Deltaproteobacteria bacterium]|nr:ATP-binding protein [Deltaproteobacteria bacterium]
MSNPFKFRELGPDDPFCDRQEEKRKLLSYATSGTNAVLFSPRRHGKTSLVRRVQAELRQRGFMTVYVDFFGVASAYETARRLAQGIYRALHERESLLEKGKRFLKAFKSFSPVFRVAEDGLSITVEPLSSTEDEVQLLGKVMEELGNFVAKQRLPINVVLDEFQEITRLKESAELEGRLRAYIQRQKVSYFFVGSRRGVLIAMFNDRKRPFFQSAVMLPLGPLPEAELVPFLLGLFKGEGKQCNEAVCRRIVESVSSHPYYVQRVAFEVFEIGRKIITEQDVNAALHNVIRSEKFGYEAIIEGLSSSEIKLLRALAEEPSTSLFSSSFVSRTGLPLATLQHAKGTLLKRDLIEEDEGGVWKVVDPLFARWLNAL